LKFPRHTKYADMANPNCEDSNQELKYLAPSLRGY